MTKDKYIYVILVFLWCIVAVGMFAFDYGYKQGQIHCIQGVIKYHKVINNTESWEKIK